MRAGSNARALARFLLRASTSPLPPPPPPRARPPALPNARVLGARASSSSSSWDALPLPKTTRALTYDAHGSPTRALTLARDLPLPPLGARGALVRWLAAPVNPADLNVVEGVYPLRPASFPAVGGNEGVGVVVRLGADAGDVVVECDAGDTDAGGDGDGDRALRVGDVVVPAAPGPGGVGGTWREWAVVDASRLRVAPSDLPLAETAQMSVNPPTAFRMLHDFVPMPRLRDDDDDDANLHAVALNAPTSAVGRAAIQLCAMYGVPSVALLRPRAAETEYDADARELKRLGASVVIRDDGAAHRDRETRELLASLPPIKLALNGVGGASSRSFYVTLVPIRPRSRGARRSLRTFSPGVSLLPPLAFNPDAPRRLSTPSDAFQLHPDVRPGRSRRCWRRAASS
jgi:mitochondrial enoyl-[acyl-carrier protein] reductase / trans-2-enoyl-CoA reductase